ncbi:MAG: patatin-like phospholipase family protein [Chloroflexota bacterium]|nr:patatin-like phospholipase family protein [Chloroflexota bacterium]
MYDLGLALSGGGCRAVAFHCGTLSALSQLDLLDGVDVVSAVSGGSLFAAAWMTAKVKGWSVDRFIRGMQTELSRGFVARSVRSPLLLALTPHVPYSRSDLLADTLDRLLFHGLTLGQLPERPALCLNATILNNGQVAKFGRDGFSAWGVSVPGATPSHVVPWSDFPLARAVMASAAFPIGFPPLTLRKRDFPKGTRFRDLLSGTTKIHLTDGGVLENLGVQTLVKGGRYSAWNLIVSDAGVQQRPWRDRGAYGTFRGLLVWFLSRRILDRVMLLMNDKQNRWARQMIYNQLLLSRLVEETHQTGPVTRERVESYVERQQMHAFRSLLFVRVAQDWRRFVRSIPRWRLIELGECVGADAASIPSMDDVRGIVDYLGDVGCDLTAARDHYATLGGDRTAHSLNSVPTGFTALSEDTVQRLGVHAAWQVHAAHAIYWDHSDPSQLVQANHGHKARRRWNRSG